MGEAPERLGALAAHFWGSLSSGGAGLPSAELSALLLAGVVLLAAIVQVVSAALRRLAKGDGAKGEKRDRWFVTDRALSSEGELLQPLESSRGGDAAGGFESTLEQPTPEQQSAEVEEERAFRSAYPGYGYDGTLDEVLADFAHLPRGEVYLDHAGATLPAGSQVRAFADAMLSSSFGNPHSASPSSQRSSDAVEAARRAVLAHFGASGRDYAVVFTSGATHAVRLVGDSLRWARGRSVLAYTRENHTSVLGLRAHAARAGAAFVALPAADVEPRLARGSLVAGAALQGGGAAAEEGAATGDAAEEEAEEALHLFAFAGECNFSGEKADLSWVPRVQALGRGAGGAGGAGGGRWLVLLDAAKLAGGAPLDLSRAGGVQPDFVCLSFYKMFGLPSGLGCLLVRRSAAAALAPRAFAGGTVASVRVDSPQVRLREELAAQLEEGTLPFLACLAVPAGLERLRRLGPARVRAHTWSLRDWTAARLAVLRHANGRPAAELYGPPPGAREGRVGGTCAFNLLRDDGGYVAYTQVAELAALRGISLRTGCFCNPGACQAALRLSPTQLDAFDAAGKSCGDDRALLDGVPTGAVRPPALTIVRVSFGYMSRWADAAALLRFLEAHFVARATASAAPPAERDIGRGAPAEAAHNGEGGEAKGNAAAAAGGHAEVEAIYVYPIKSCAAQRCDGAWPLAYADPPAPALARSESAAGAAGALWPLKLPRVLSWRPRAAAPRPPAPPPQPPAPRGAGGGSGSDGSDSDGAAGAAGAAGAGGARCGLAFDREWAVVDPEGRALTQKACARLAALRPAVDLRARTLRVECAGRAPLELPLDELPHDGAGVERARVCGREAGGVYYGERESRWFSDALGRECFLVRRARRGAGAGGEGGGGGAGGGAFHAKGGELLLISRESLTALAARLARAPRAPGLPGASAADADAEELALRLRPNLLARWVPRSGAAAPGGAAGWEDALAAASLALGGDRAAPLRVAGPCQRCTMVNVDPRSQQVTPETLLALSGYRREARRGRVCFGVLLDFETHPSDLPRARAEAVVVGARLECAFKAGGVRWLGDE